MPRKIRHTRKRGKKVGGDIEEGPTPRDAEHYPLPPKYDPSPINPNDAASVFDRPISPYQEIVNTRDNQVSPSWDKLNIFDNDDNDNYRGGRKYRMKKLKSRRTRRRSRRYRK